MPWIVPDDDASSESQKPEQAEVPLEKSAHKVVQAPPQHTLPVASSPVPQTPYRRERKEADKAREERIRRASNGGTRIPTLTEIDGNEGKPSMTQAEYNLRKHQAAEYYLQMIEERRAKTGVGEIRGCTTCDIANRKHGPDCVGWCERFWR
jgi:hypothetical protein